MATGVLPFKGELQAAIFDSILHKVPAAPVRFNDEVPPELERIINKALEKDRELRYQHASDLRADLKRLKRETSSSRSMVQQSSEEDDGPPPSSSVNQENFQWSPHCSSAAPSSASTHGPLGRGSRRNMSSLLPQQPWLLLPQPDTGMPRNSQTFRKDTVVARRFHQHHRRFRF